MNNLFYLHPAKCGGQSVLQSLKDMNIKYFFQTNELHLNKCCLELLQSKQRSIVFGHIDYLPTPKTVEEANIRGNILEILYFKSDLVMPTRNPANLLQSWMHYAKTRSNIVMRDYIISKNPIVGKDRDMLFKMSALRQNCLVFAENGKSARGKGVDFPTFRLQEEDEEWNLLAFADFLRANGASGTLPQLCSMQFQLFAPYWPSIKARMLSGKSVRLNPPVTTSVREVFYYDCENIGPVQRNKLDELIGPSFGKRLVRTRENVSISKNKRKGCEFSSVKKKLQAMVPGEWQVYVQSS